MAVLLLSSCVGPEAPDAAVCRDLIHRLCLMPVCSPVVLFITPGNSCDATLLANTGCLAEDFVFTSPTREKFLSCRVPVIRGAANVEAHPACTDVSESFERCPDVVRFLSGTR